MIHKIDIQPKKNAESLILGSLFTRTAQYVDFIENSLDTPPRGLGVSIDVCVWLCAWGWGGESHDEGSRPCAILDFSKTAESCDI